MKPVALFFMAIIWNTQPQSPIEEEQEAIAQETVDEAEGELKEELEEARKFVPKGFGS
jgi:hypothetical protein